MQALATATRVRAQREAAGLTQQTLATRAQISLRTLSRIEGGEDCTVSTLARIAKALDIPLGQLVDEPSEAAS